MHASYLRGRDRSILLTSSYERLLRKKPASMRNGSTLRENTNCFGWKLALSSAALQRSMTPARWRISVHWRTVNLRSARAEIRYQEPKITSKCSRTTVDLPYVSKTLRKSAIPRWARRLLEDTNRRLTEGQLRRLWRFGVIKGMPSKWLHAPVWDTK